jgi:hypothetical protein
VSGHDAHAVCLLFENRRLGALAGTRLLFQPAHERAEGKHAPGVSLSREFRDAMQIGQTSGTAAVESDRSVGSNGFQCRADGFGDREVVALAVQFAENREGLPDRFEFGVGIFGRLDGWPEPAVLFFEPQQGGTRSSGPCAP